MNETLEAMAQALFKSWFVNFDPVIDNALANGKEIPEELSEKAQARAVLGDKRRPLPEEIRTLFPDEFTYSEELGWIPKGWEPVTLSWLINVKHGFAFKGEYFSKEPTKDILLTPGNFHIGGGFKADKFKYYSGPIPNGYILSENDILVTMTDLSKEANTLGFPALVPETDDNRFLHNQRIGKIEIINDKAGKMFLYQCLRQKKYRDEILSSATGTTVKHTSPTKILAHVVSFSGGHAEATFETMIKLFAEKICKNNYSINLLSKHRDTLLPKLLSGELRIPGA